MNAEEPPPYPTLKTSLCTCGRAQNHSVLPNKAAETTSIVAPNKREQQELFILKNKHLN